MREPLLEGTRRTMMILCGFPRWVLNGRDQIKAVLASAFGNRLMCTVRGYRWGVEVKMYGLLK